jgi:hypothetical protein
MTTKEIYLHINVSTISSTKYESRTDLERRRSSRCPSFDLICAGVRHMLKNRLAAYRYNVVEVGLHLS